MDTSKKMFWLSQRTLTGGRTQSTPSAVSELQFPQANELMRRHSDALITGTIANLNFYF